MRKIFTAFLPALFFMSSLFAQTPTAERSVHGVVALFAAGRLMLVLDRDAGPGLPVNTTLTFIVNPQTKVFERERAATSQSIQTDQEATVSYLDTRSGLVAREVRLLGKHDYGKPGAEPSRPASPESPATRPPRTPPASVRGGARGREQTIDPDQLAKLTEVRLQSSDRQGAPAIDRVKPGVDFFIAFYVQVNATSAFRLSYRCQRPDFSTGGMKIMSRCSYEETIPAGFRGVKFHAVPMRYEREGNSGAGNDVIAGEVAPIVSTGRGTVIPWQRKLAPVSIQP